MAVTGTLYASAQNKTAAGTIVLTTSGIIPANTLLVLALCCDNVAAATPTISSITNVGGGTWANRAGATTQSGASTTAGSGVFVYCQTLFTSSSVANGTAITVTFNASPAVKSVGIVGFSEMSGTLRNTVVSAASTVGTPSAVTTGTALVAGDLVIGVFGAETSATIGGDADTLNGAWQAMFTLSSSGGQAATNVGVCLDYKVVTATGAQTYNPSGGANDSVAIVFAMVPATPVAPVARTLVAAAGTPAQTVVNLTWTADSVAIPAPTYLIERSPDGSTGWTTVISGLANTVTGYDATGLTHSTTYYFRITGSSTAGSSTSNVAGPITTAAYVAPTSRSISLTQGFYTSSRCRLEWVSDSAALPTPTYEIQKSTTSSSSGFTTHATGQPGNTYDVIGLTVNQPYWFKVIGSNIAGSSESNVLPYTPVYYTYSNDYEGTDEAAVTTDSVFSGSVKFDTARSHGGASSARFDTAGVVTVLGDIFFATLPSSQMYHRFYLYLTAYPNATMNLIQPGNPSITAAVVWLLSTGELRLGPTVTMTNKVALNQWVRIESSALPTSACRLYNTTESSTPTEEITNAATISNLTRTQFGCNTSGVTTTFWFDDLAISEETWPGSSSPAAGGQPKIYSGSAFNKKPLKVYSGSAFNAKPVKVWTGSVWKTLT